MKMVVAFVVAVIIAFSLSMAVKFAYNYCDQKASQREGAAATPAATSTPQTEPKPYVFEMNHDDGDTCMGYVYTTRELPLDDAGFLAPFKFIQREMDFAGAGYQYFFSSSPLFNCSNVRRNVETAALQVAGM